MNKYLPLALISVPAIICPSHAQDMGKTLSASEFVQAQMNILKGVTELLNIKSIADAPQEVAASINQLSAMLVALAQYKPVTTPEEVALIETEFTEETKEVSLALQQALQKTVDMNFYGSEELLAAIQNFANSMQQLK